MQLVVEQLRKNKKASFADIKAAAQRKRLKLYPITYGRAKALLGLVPSAKRGEGKAARASAASGRGMKRGPGRPPKLLRRGPGRPRKTVTAISSLDAFVAAMKQNEGTAAAYRAALERAFDILRAALNG